MGQWKEEAAAIASEAALEATFEQGLQMIELLFEWRNKRAEERERELYKWAYERKLKRERLAKHIEEERAAEEREKILIGLLEQSIALEKELQNLFDEFEFE